MAAQNTLSHQLPGEPGMADRASQAGARFSSLAENVAEGPSAESIHRQWMNSPPHRANLLDPNSIRWGLRWPNATASCLPWRIFHWRREAVRGRARGNCRRETSVARAAALELNERRAPLLRPGQRLCRKPRPFLRPALRDARSANAPGPARTENPDRQVPFRSRGRLSQRREDRIFQLSNRGSAL